MIIPIKAYGHKRELPKKTRLATQDKSKQCFLSSKHHPCLPSVITVAVSINEDRRMCQRHLDICKRKGFKFEPKFTKASEI